MTDADLLWLAGVLEAEGYFANSRIIVEMKDQDTIARIAGLWERSYRQKERRRPHWADTFVTGVYGATARAWTARLWPHMGEGTRGKIVTRNKGTLPCYNELPISPETLPRELQLCWVAGLLEGDGSFMKPSPHARGSVVVKLGMCDAEVMRTVGRLWKRAVTADKPHGKARQQYHRCRLYGPAAVDYMLELYPHLMQRRRAQVITAITEYRLRVVLRKKCADVTV